MNEGISYPKGHYVKFLSLSLSFLYYIQMGHDKLFSVTVVAICVTAIPITRNQTEYDNSKMPEYCSILLFYITLKQVTEIFGWLTRICLLLIVQLFRSYGLPVCNLFYSVKR